MKLTRHNLTYNLSGNDVAALQTALGRLGYKLPAAETSAMRFGVETQKAVIAVQRDAGLRPDGIVDRGTVFVINSALADKVKSAKRLYSVSGTAYYPDGKPFVGKVILYDCTLRKRKELGNKEVELGASGKFAISYSPQKFAQAAKSAADLGFELVDAKSQKANPFSLSRRSNGEWEEVPNPRVIFQADPVEEVTITIGEEAYRGPSEYAQIFDLVTPLVADIDGGLAKLDPDPMSKDILYLAGQTAQDAKHIELLIRAFKIVDETRLIDKADDLEPEACYGLFRMGLPTEMVELANLDLDVLRRALELSARKNIISALWSEEEAIRHMLTQLRSAFVNYSTHKDNGSRIRDLLDITLHEADLQKRFLHAYLAHKGDAQTFWQKLRDSADGDDLHPLRQHADALQQVFDLGELVDWHAPLVEYLQTKAGHKTVRELAQYDAADWQFLMEKNHIAVPEDFEKTADAKTRLRLHAEKLTHQIEDALPSEFVTYRVISLAKTDEGRSPLAKFLKRNVLDAGPDKGFDLQTSLIGSYLKANPAALQDVVEAQRPAFMEDLKTFQRLYRLAPRFQHAQVLQDASYHSAYAITQKGKNAFIRQMGKDVGGDREAENIYDRARWKKAATLALYGELMTSLKTPAIHALNSLPASKQIDQSRTLLAATSPQASTADLRQYSPDLQELIGTMDLCECEHCRSFYSPAAYLVDILHWLAQRPENANGRSPKKILIKRRPDLEDIELSCENTNTVLPYVDLVNEILEDAVAPLAHFTPFNLANSQNENDLADLVHHLDTRNTPGLIAAFATNTPLSQEASISIQQAGESWTIAEPGYTYAIRKTIAGTNHLVRVVSRSRQTSGTARERRALPQYVNDSAYERLRHTVYPWTMPFDLWETEARTYLGHLGTSRQALAEVFAPTLNHVDVLNDATIAAQGLGLTAAERLQISGVRTATTTNLENLAGALTIDNVVLKTGDWLLVKNQTDATQNGVYMVQKGIWLRLFAPTAEGRLVTFVQAGSQAGRCFYLQSTSPFSGAQTLDLFWGQPMDLRVRFATRAHQELVGLDTLAGVGLREGDLVLVKDHKDKSKNGVYRAQKGDWTPFLKPSETPLYVAVAQGHDYFRLDQEGKEVIITPLGQWSGALTHVDLFLRQSGLGDPRRPETGYGELLELLETRFINPDRQIRIGSADNCALTEMVIEFHKPNAPLLRKPQIKPGDRLHPFMRLARLLEWRYYDLDGAQIKTWDRLHRFVRLARLLEWRFYDLDRALKALGITNLDDDLIVKLSHIGRLQERLGTPCETILSWWATLDTTEYTDHAAEGRPVVLSPYDRLFRNPARNNPLDLIFELNTTRDELRDSSRKFGDHAVAVAAGLEVNVTDLELIIPDLAGQELTLARLSYLHRVTSLAKALHLSIRDFLIMRRLSSHNPFNGWSNVGLNSLPDNLNLPAFVTYDTSKKELRAANPLTLNQRDELLGLSSNAVYQAAVNELYAAWAAIAETLLFVEDVERVRASGFSIAELEYLLCHGSASILKFAPADPDMAEWLADLRRQLRKIVDENNSTATISNPDGALMQEKLSLLDWETDIVKQTVALLGGQEVYVQRLSPLPASLPDFQHLAGPFEVKLDPLPNNITLPRYVTYEATTKTLHAIRALIPTERDDLLHLSDDPAYQIAVHDLYTAPTAIGERVSWDTTRQALLCRGPMTQAMYDSLLLQTLDQAYQYAIQELSTASQRSAQRNLRYFVMPACATHLDQLPAGLTFPDELGKRIAHDATAKQLRYTGVMTDEDCETLKMLTGNSDSDTYRNAIDELFNQGRKLSGSRRFLTDTDLKTLFDSPYTPEKRFKQVLEYLLPVLATTLSENLIAQETAEKFNLDAGVARKLLDVLQPSLDATGNCLSVLKEAKFVSSDPDVSITEELGFLPHFQAFERLYKAATIINRLKLNLVQLRWILEYPAAVDWLDLNTLPVRKDLASVALSGLICLIDLTDVRDRLPGGEMVLDELFGFIKHAHTKTARSGINEQDKIQIYNQDKTKYIEALSQWTSWPEGDLIALLGMKGNANQTGLLGMAFPEHYGDERLLLHLLDCFVLTKRLGVSSTQTAAWSSVILNKTDSQGVLAAIKAKYDEAAWLELAPRLKDPLRNRQRAALVEYLVANPGMERDEIAQRQSSSDLYAHFLIDVEMDACMDTSRIRQAIGSAQLFVQRCLLNLEQPGVKADADEDENWRQWEWMKTYRVWEANRKIFLYPENWIEPELRDDKTPFFKDLENELLQKELTDANAEMALLRYLEKLDQIARLEIMGICQDTDSKIWHIFGRTHSKPHLYFYRRKDGENWSPWEKVELDIEGDHLVPAVWNRHLYLLWPNFLEKSQDAEFADSSSKPNVFWEVSLAWSEYRRGSWSPKKISETYEFPPSQSSRRASWGSSLPRGKTRRFFFRYDEKNSSLEIDVYFDGREGNHPIEEEDDHKLEHDFTFRMAAGSSKMVASNSYTSPSIYPPPGMLALDQGFEKRENGPNQPFDLDSAVTYQLVFSSHEPSFSHPGALTYQDTKRVFFAEQSQTSTQPVSSGRKKTGFQGLVKDDSVYRAYSLSPLYHPYVPDFLARLQKGQVKGLLSRETQVQHSQEYSDLLDPSDNEMIVSFYPKKEGVDFEGGSYSLYNWELFFHAPLLIADQLRKNQRFEEARKWFHYIFDPTDASSEDGSQRYWRTQPLYEQASHPAVGVQEMLEQFARRNGNRNLTAQIEAWRSYPFQPHRIARLRTAAYQKTVLMRYLDNLLAWGDQLFRRDTLETINEATQLYVMAADLLGKRPSIIPSRRSTPVQTYKTLEPGLDGLGNALVPLEYQVIGPSDNVHTEDKHNPLLDTLAFCVPANEKLLNYWKTVADRLFNLRHCMNIEGVFRRLPLFEPPIDPALLARAGAAGVDISSVLSDSSAPLPHYRFNLMAQKASELAAEVKSLGAALLSAMEKRDAEELARLRSTHEIAVLNAVRQVRENQVKEAKASWDSLLDSKRVIDERHNYYRDIAFLNPAEVAQALLAGVALEVEALIMIAYMSASGSYVIPDTKLGAPTSIGITLGGSNIGPAFDSAAAALRSISSTANTAASISGTLGSHMRRWDEWKFQERMAKIELDQIADQLVATEIRHALAENELENHDLQIENAKAVDEAMRSKFSNQELYEWMVGQISSMYFQSYQLAYDVAKRAERAFRHELGLQESNYIQFGYWDSLKNGLLAGERLHQDIKRMEVAYLDQNRREHELAKHISLLQMNPKALIALKETGRCEIELPEDLFDIDFPGHYLRRIRSVSLTIPCVTGPYSGIHSKLTLLKSTLRHRNNLGASDAYARDLNSDDLRFSDQYDGIQSVVTSSAQNDSGLFDSSLGDGRYLPFEGTGAISTWRLELPREFPQFDHRTISDVILHLRYTARDGGESLRQKAVEHVQQLIKNAQASGMVRLFSLRQEFSSQWAAYKAAPKAGDFRPLKITLTPQHYPFWSRSMTNETRNALKAALIVRATGEVKVARPDGTHPDTLGAFFGNLQKTEITQAPKPPFEGEWNIGLSNDSVEDVWLLVHWDSSQNA